MSETNAALGYGAVLSISDNVSPRVFVEVGELTDFDFNGFSVDQIDATHLQSPDATTESIPGLKKPGTITLTGNFTGETGQMKLNTYLGGRVRFAWKIEHTLGDGSAYLASGLGYVAKGHKGPFDAQKKVDFNFDIQATGAVVETVTAP